MKNFYPIGKRKIKKVIQEFYFSDLRAGWTKRAGDLTDEIFEKKLTKLFTRSKINTYHIPHVNYAWK